MKITVPQLRTALIDLGPPDAESAGSVPGGDSGFAFAVESSASDFGHSEIFIGPRSLREMESLAFTSAQPVDAPLATNIWFAPHHASAHGSVHVTGTTLMHGALHIFPPVMAVSSAAAPPPPSLTQAQVDSLAAGFEQTLTKIESNLVAQVFGENLPLVGSKLVDAAASGVPALHYVTALKTAVNSGLGTLTGSATYTEAQVEGALASALNAAGINSGGGGPNLDLSNASDIKLSFVTSKSFAAFDSALDVKLGLPGLGLQTSGTAHTTLNYALTFGVGLDGATGTDFYLNSTNGGSTFGVALDTKIPDFNASAKIGPLRFMANDLAAPNGTDFNAGFAVKLKDPNNDGHLRAGELNGDLVDATLSGNAKVRLHLASDLGTAVLPNIAADLNFDWGFNNSVVDPTASQATFGSAPTASFKNISLGLGSFFDDFVSPVFGKLQLLTGPLQPIVDVLETEIKPLSELSGSKVTVLSIAETTGEITPESAARLHLFGQLISFINSVPTNGGATRIDLGDYGVGGLDLRDVAYKLADAIPAPIRNAIAAGEQSPTLKQFLDGKNALPGGGLAFPIIENPSTAINLLIGKPVDFFTYHVPNLDIGPAGFDAFFRIFGPLGVRLKGVVEAHAFLDIGYDTSGVVQFATSGLASDILNGFYVVDQPGPEATLKAQISAALALNVLFAEAGVAGGVFGNLDIFLNDLDHNPNDGRVHLTELNGGCLFKTSGELVAGLSAYLTIGWGPVSETFEKTFASVKLMDFSGLGCDPNNNDGSPVLAHLLGANVALNVGGDAAMRQIGDVTDNAEDFAVFHVSGTLGDETVAVAGGGLLKTDGTPASPQNYHAGANGRITADGGEKDDSLVVVAEVLTPATLRGGAGNDRIIGGGGNDTLYGDAGLDALFGNDGNDSLSGGADQDYLDGQGGDDTLSGGAEGDILIGGTGADVLDGGSGFDTASYATATAGVVVNLQFNTGSNDAQGDSYISIERIVGSPSNDLLLGNDANNNFGGAAGDDLLDGGGGDDLLSGDAGADQLTGGAGNDFAAYTISPSAVNVSLFTGNGTGGDAQGDTLNGIENLQGSTDFGDTLEGDNGPNWLRGLNGNNTLRGLGGNDLIEGGKDNDFIDGGNGNDTLKADQDPASNDPSVGGGIDTLLGGAGNDTLYGDAGGDTLDGGADDDQIYGGKSGDMISGGDGNDTLRANFDPASTDPLLSGGIDTLIGGAGNDILYGDAGGDTLDGGEGDDQIYGGKDNDTIFGRGGSDLIYGGAGHDSIDAGEGMNVIYGDDGNDVITSGAGPDYLSGGAGNDTLNAGAGLNYLFGDGGNDVLTALEGNDELNGGANDDQLDAGEGSNLLNGDAGNDILISGSGSDSLHGGTGNDAANSGAGNDFVFGDDDNDSLDAGIGADRVDGGTGNDFLSVGALRGAVQDAERLDRLDGGTGFDTVTADFSNQTIPITVIAGQTQSYNFADGSYVRNFENVHDFFTGSGDDVLRLDGASDDGFGSLLKTGVGADVIYSGAGNDNVDAGDGDDFVNGGNGGDVLAGGAGVDTLSYFGSPAAVSVSLVAGTASGGWAQGDIHTGFEYLEGSDVAGGGDVLEGSAVDNQIRGFAGPDTLRGLAGNDLLLGEDGDDSLDAGIGTDRVDGGNGNDFLSVGALRGPVQDAERLDHLFGGAGFDTITADFSNQTIPMVVTAGQTQSLIFADGTEARDFENVHDLFTGSANDVLRLDGAADDGFGNLLKTGAGDDIVYSGAGSDNVDAGDGNDFVNCGSNDFTLTFGGLVNGVVLGFTGPGETFAGGAGTDTISFEASAKPIPPGSYGAGGFLGVLVNLATNATDGAARGITISGFENIIGTDYADELTGDAGPNVIYPLYGGGISPTATFNGGPDRIDGAGGEDTLVIDFTRNDQADSTGVSINRTDISRSSPTGGYERWIYDNIERVVFTGGSKNDSLYPGIRDHDDILSGLGGNDQLGGGGGADTLLGGEGDDSLTGQGFAPGQYDGTAGGHDILDGGPGNDLVEEIAFENSAPKMDAATALFELDGGAGFDRLSVDFSNQTAAIIWDSAAPTNMEFANGTYARNFEQLRYFATGSGNDVITQLGRVDNLFYLGAGNDTINPGLGADSVQGGAGSDTLILDYSIGDTPTANGVIAANPSYNAPDGGYFSRTDPATGLTDSIQFYGFEHVRATGGMHDDYLVGVLIGDDVLFGGPGNDTLDGAFGGNDYLDGGDGNDVLRGADPAYGGGNDTMLGGPGNDTFFPRNGNDTISGGAGNDVITATNYPTDGYGSDFWDAGDGDDVVTNLIVNSGYSYTNAATRMHLDGGPGFDKLSADFGNETQAITFIGGASNSVDFADGSYFRNFEAIGDFTSGSGNDTFVVPGRADNQIGLGAGDDSLNPGLGTDYLFGGYGNDLLILDFSAGDDANLAGVILEGSFLRRRDAGTGAIVDDIFFTEFEHVQITGSSKADTFNGLDGSDILVGGDGNDVISGGSGNDLLDGGPGADTMTGGPGDDTFVVDSIADIIAEQAGGGNDTVNAVIDYTLGANFENLILSGHASSGTGNSIANIITGNPRNNDLHGGDGADVLTGGTAIGLAGSHEVDILDGGAGADTFVLGDADFRFYDDRSSLTPGTDGYARIADFTPSAGDRLKLHGTAAEFLLGNSPLAGVPGTAIFHDTDFDGLLDPAHDELIAILDSPDALTHLNTIDVAIFV